MKFLSVFTTILIAFLFIGCENKGDQITNADDYDSFLISNDNKKIDFALKEIEFWQNKFDKAPNQTSYLNQIAANYSVLFEQTGNIQSLYKAEELLIKSNQQLNYTDASSLRSLAKNYITQHRFKEALDLANKAFKTNDKIKETHKLLFDVHMELGNYDLAKNSLRAISDSNDFDYLIRLAKWNDHKGDLDAAIAMMEKATGIAEKYDNKYLLSWTYSNLGDMYGHAGNIEESYKHYIKTLKIDPNNSFALKGLAWIAFSHEKNTSEAKRIIDIVSKKHNSPDFYLLKAEIAEYEKDFASQESFLKQYFNTLANKNYGVMYNKYNGFLYADDNNTLNKTLYIAKQEISNRPTPQSYDLLAWYYYKKGNAKEALEIVNKHVVNKSFEPEVLYHIACIYKANNVLNEIKPIKKELQASVYELGPNMVAKIDRL